METWSLSVLVSLQGKAVEVGESCHRLWTGIPSSKLQLCTYATGRPPRVPLILMGDKAPLQCRKYVYGFVLDNATCYLVWPQRNSVDSCHVLHTSTENALALEAPFPGLGIHCLGSLSMSDTLYS